METNQQKDADELIQRMFSFVPASTSGILSAKFCARVACDYLIETLPNINDTPPIYRMEERKYSQYWRGVKLKLE